MNIVLAALERGPLIKYKGKWRCGYTPPRAIFRGDRRFLRKPARRKFSATTVRLAIEMGLAQFKSETVVERV